jgi:transposase
MMEVIIERCAGLDVHQATVVACVLIGQAGRKPHKEIRTFSTMTRDLEAMRDWLKGVTHVGLESTGIYWKPVHTILEGHFELIVANAHHIKTVPGQGCRVDRRPGAPRLDQTELRATAANP